MNVLEHMLKRLRRPDPKGYVYSESFSGKFDSLDAAHAAHAEYKHDTDEEGQFDPEFRTYIRVQDTIDGIPGGSVVLDIGCNSGGLGRRLIGEKGCQMYGVDLNPKMVERAVAKGYQAYAGPAEDLRFEDELFDVVVVSEILEHLYDPHPVLAQAKRVLKPGGLLFGDVPTETGYWGYETIVEHAYHARVFTRASLDELLSGYFRVDKLEGVPSGPGAHPVYDVPTWYAFRCTKA